MENFLEKAFTAVPEIKKALSLKISADILKHDLSIPHVVILRELAAGEPRSIGALGKKLDISHAMMTHLTDQLEEKGLAKRNRCEEDRRVIRISITARGSQMIEKIRAIHRDSLKKLLSKFSDADCEAFIRNFNEIYRLIIKYGENQR